MVTKINKRRTAEYSEEFHFAQLLVGHKHF
jgi:hypothetical protein